MTSIWPSVVKEFRALFPVWISAIAVMMLRPLTTHDVMQVMAVLAYVFGSLALGAHAIGHEHSYRTLAILLAQPVERRKLLITKFAVLTPLIVSLAVAAWYVVLNQLGAPRAALATIFLPVFGGLFVAPWITMVLRNQLGGVMVTGMAAGWSLIVTGVLAAKLSGLDPGQAEQLAVDIWTWMMYAFAAISAVFGWRTFMGLEAIEGGATQLHLPRWFRIAERSRSQQPVWRLIRKELRLQQLTFVMAGFFLAGELVRGILEANGLVRADESIRDALIPIYLAAIALVAGSMASAEERLSGMLQSQLLLPVAAWQQWAIKASVAIGLVLLLGIGPVALVTYAGGQIEPVDRLLPSVVIGGMLILVMTTSALYVSSLSSSGVRALAAVFPFLVVTYLLWEFIMTRADVRSHAVYLCAFAFVALLLVFAGINHRRIDRSFTRVLWQVGSAAVLIVAGIPLFTALVNLTV